MLFRSISAKQTTPFHLKSKGSSEQAQLFIIRLPLQQTGSFVQDVCCLRIMKYPFCDLLPLQDQRHSVMHRLHGSVCGSRKDHKMLSVFIPSAKPRHKQKRHIVPAKCVLLFPGIPFVKPGCRNHDTPVLYAGPEQRLFQCRLTSGIEDQLFPLIAGKSPALQAAAQGAVFFRQHRRSHSQLPKHPYFQTRYRPKHALYYDAGKRTLLPLSGNTSDILF